MDNLINNKIITEIEDLLQKARSHVAVEVNKTLLKTYMEIGRLKILIRRKTEKITNPKPFPCFQRNSLRNSAGDFLVQIYGI